jgi:serpin B
MYFKGSWKVPFDKRYTGNKLFYRLDGRTVDVPFMKSSALQYIAVHDGFKVLKLRYKMQNDQPLYYGRYGTARDFCNFSPPDTPEPSTPSECTQFSLCVFLPDASDGLRSLVDTIASQPGFMHEHLPKEKTHVSQFWLPKFKLSFHDSIVSILKKMGLELAFGIRADLSGMVEDDVSGWPLVLDEVIHKAVIEVNEEGTEAAAASVISTKFGCYRSLRPVEFVADHPFAYFLVEEATGAVVFAGHVLDPSREN